MEISNIAANKLITLDRNPRTITRKELAELKESLIQDPDFMNKRPVLVNLVEGKYLIYAGTQRYKGLKELGYDTIPCFVQENIPTNVMERRMVLDNLHSGVWEFKGDTVAEFAPIGSLIGDKFHMTGEQVTGFTTESVLEPRSKTPTRNFYDIEFSTEENYKEFLDKMESLNKEFPHLSMGARLVTYLRANYGGTRD